MKWYFGIKSVYPRIINIFGERIAVYAQLCRPLTLVAPLICGLLGVFIERVYTLNDLSFPIIYAILCGLVLMLYQAVGQITNQSSDILIDLINKPYRPLVQGFISFREVNYLTVAFIIGGITISFLIDFDFFLITLIMLFMALGYSIEPIRIKRRNQWLALTWISFSRGFLPFLATWSVFNYILSSPMPWIFGLIGFLWVMFAQPTKDFSDIKGDAAYDIPTLPTRYGERKTIFIMSNLAIIFYLALFLLLPINWILVTGFHLIFGAFILFSLITGLKADSLENNPAWVGFYAGLGMLYVLILICLILF